MVFSRHLNAKKIDKIDEIDVLNPKTTAERENSFRCPMAS